MSVPSLLKIGYGWHDTSGEHGFARAKSSRFNGRKVSPERDLVLNSTSSCILWRQHIVALLACALICTLAPNKDVAAQPVASSESPDTKQANQTAKLFDDICYSNLPEFRPIINQAKKQKWTPITGDALRAFAPEVAPDQLQAWSFLKDGVKFQISISSGPADKALQEALPKFANARAFACSLILPGLSAQSAVDQAVQKLIGRPADERYEAAPFKVHFWSGITDQLAALMYHYKPKSGAPGGLISFVVLKK